MAYNRTDGSGKVILFGGVCGCGNYGGYADYTWTYAGGHWKNISSTLLSAPPGLVAAVMAHYVGAKGGQDLLLFGGATSNVYGSSILQNATYRLGSLRWDNLTSTLLEAPPTVVYPGMAWDGAASAIILFGGSMCNSFFSGGSCGTSGSLLSNQTWEWHFGHWKLL
jgi:hypothetical protein